MFYQLVDHPGTPDPVQLTDGQAEHQQYMAPNGAWYIWVNDASDALCLSGMGVIWLAQVLTETLGTQVGMSSSR
jgi:hypothetical protein